MKTETRIIKNIGKKTANVLAEILKKEFLLYTKTLEAHRDIDGPDLYTKEVFLEENYSRIKRKNESEAEQVRMIRLYGPATMKQFLNLTNLTENADRKYIEMLLNKHDVIIKLIRSNIFQITYECKDARTPSFLNTLMIDHKDMIMMIQEKAWKKQEKMMVV